MILTEAELRALYQNGKRHLPEFPEGTRFTPAALDFLHSIQCDKSSEKAPSAADNKSTQSWDHPGSFTIDPSGKFSINSGPKPDTITQLDSKSFGSKNDPKIILRGRLDTLNACFLLTASHARKQNLNEIAAMIDTLGAYCREILSAEYHNRPPMPIQLAGLDEQAIHKISHEPEQIFYQSHLEPTSSSPELLLWLNWLRAESREVELCAIPLNRMDLIHALNRLSAAIYVIECIYNQAVSIHRQPGAA